MQEAGYGYSGSGEVDKLMLDALREEREALRRHQTASPPTVEEDSDRTALQVRLFYFYSVVHFQTYVHFGHHIFEV